MTGFHGQSNPVRLAPNHDLERGKNALFAFFFIFSAFLEVFLKIWIAGGFQRDRKNSTYGSQSTYQI
jgi:hypothetical protein